MPLPPQRLVRAPCWRPVRALLLLAAFAPVHASRVASAAGEAPESVGPPTQSAPAAPQEREELPLEETPRSLDLSPGGEVRVDVWRGDLEVHSRRGDMVRLEIERETEEGGACQRVQASRTPDGGIAIRTRPQGPELCPERLRLRLGIPGGARLRALVSDGHIALEAASGSFSLVALADGVKVRGAEGVLDVESAAGDIRVAHSAAQMKLESVSGRIVVEGALRAPLHARSVTGGIALRLSELAPVLVSAETLSGDIEVGYPPGPRPGLEIAPGQGKLETDFVLPEEERGADGGRLVRAVEEGRPLLRLRTLGGHIRLQAGGAEAEDQEPEETDSEKT